MCFILLHYIIYVLTLQKIATAKRVLLDFHIFHCKILVVTCLKIAYEQVETCSTYVNATFLITINLCCVGRNKRSLLSNKHNRMASITTAYKPTLMERAYPCAKPIKIDIFLCPSVCTQVTTRDRQNNIYRIFKYNFYKKVWFFCCV